MSTVTFKKEAQTYDDALKTYNRQLNSHNAKVDTYNAAADTYNNSFATDAKGNKYLYVAPSMYVEPQQQMTWQVDPITHNSMPVFTTIYVNKTRPEMFIPVGSSGKVDRNSAVFNPPIKNYALTDAGNGYQVLRVPLAAGQSYPTEPTNKPEAWTQKFTMEKPDLTIGQKARLDQPNLTDLERNNSGLINSAFNF